MGKMYKVNMDIDVSKVSVASGFLMKEVDKDIDERGLTERTGAEVFAFLCDVAIQGANPKVSFDQLRSHRKIIKALQQAKKGYTTSKTDLDIIKNSVRNNRNWPNSDEMFDILDQIMENLIHAEEVNENPTPNS